ncbi:formate dehydrogenase accessory sulfurtransferase FdhD [Marinococcus luteus]|uniref:formate dehydrogenase accessory sulfurtransferase FdhD n=1 Tax=Marinococcus luteus TaxID=1122204 RepID=UPI002ACC53E5|nr:formate dehydrogenase accessory sulfurtransferase FdhD [Marinococcus luteus]MDZ5784023.1 formate dehydrogenase accessory sulfurtransferase FdhD [Marinococcus luteus]
MPDRSTAIQPIVSYSPEEGLYAAEDQVALEKPMTIVVNDEEFATLVCTPTHVEELVVGFLASEGVILFYREIESVSLDDDLGFAYVSINSNRVKEASFYSKRVIGSCCGKSRQFYFQSDVQTAKTAVTKRTLTPEQCLGFMKEMQDNSVVFKNTGGVHNAAICDTDGIIVDRSDIGRHNALDKLYGYCLMNGIQVRDKVLVFSGRLSSEVLTKAAKMGMGIILSKSAPTNLAIRLADDLNITAVGFIRGSTFNVYAHAERISADVPSATK